MTFSIGKKDKKSINIFCKKLAYGLSFLAITPALESILFIDVPAFLVKPISTFFFNLLKEVSGVQEKIVFLPTAPSEDQLWGAPYLKQLNNNSHYVKKDSLFPDNIDTSIPRIVVVPNLVHLEMTGRRALSTILNTPVVNIERYGSSREFFPNLMCLAFCRERDLIYISRHLLDRFSIRLNANYMTDVLRKKIRYIYADRTIYTLENQVNQAIDRIKQGLHIKPEVSDDTLNRVLYYSDKAGGQGHRREIALLRLAISIAKLNLQSSVRTEDVGWAAELQGLKPSIPKKIKRPTFYLSKFEKKLYQKKDDPAPQLDKQDDNLKDQSQPPLTPLINEPQKDRPHTVAEKENERHILVQESKAEVTTTLTISKEHEILFTYSEDQVYEEAALSSLQPRLARPKGTKHKGGVIIGSLRSHTLDDISFIDTIKAALPFQKYRKRLANQPLRIQLVDLRRNLRSAVPRKMMILLVDLSNSIVDNWESALLKELNWAYVERAIISLILVGVGDNCYQAQSKLISHRQIVSLKKYLNKTKGNASPLAHGLLLALKQTEKSTRKGRDLIQEVRFVLATDGHANIPLSISLGEKLQAYSGLKAFQDTLKIAEELKRNPRVKITLLEPQIGYHPELSLCLASALGAKRTFIELPEK